MSRSTLAPSPRLVYRLRARDGAPLRGPRDVVPAHTFWHAFWRALRATLEGLAHR